MCALIWTQTEPTVFTADDAKNNWRYTVFQDDMADDGSWVVEVDPLDVVLATGVQPTPVGDVLAEGLTDLTDAQDFVNQCATPCD